MKIQKALQKGKRGILIVENEAIVRVLLKNLIELKGYAVYTSKTAGHAREILEKTDISILITDIGLPDMTGSAFTLEIKDKYPNMPVLMITGLSTNHSNIAKACGADGQITIPYVNTNIADLLNRCMRKKSRVKVK